MIKALLKIFLKALGISIFLYTLGWNLTNWEWWVNLLILHIITQIPIENETRKENHD
jgi:hypothetical protein